jgi:hypothetical protein
MKIRILIPSPRAPCQRGFGVSDSAILSRRHLLVAVCPSLYSAVSVQNEFRRTRRSLNRRLKRGQSLLDFALMKCLHQKSTEIANGIGHLRIDFATADLADRFAYKLDDIVSVEQTCIRRRAWEHR